MTDAAKNKKADPKEKAAPKKDAEDEKKKDSDKNGYEMEYRMLGGTGLRVSTFSFGFWATYGVKEGIERCMAVIDICRDHGVNFFDNAEAYGKNYGDAELILGEAIQKLRKKNPDKWRRSDLVISTKIFWGGKGPNESGLSMKHLIEGTNGALKRLQVDYVDLIFAHRPDPLTPTEEIVRGFTQIIQSGKALYWGTSEWTAQQITEAYWIAKMHNLIAPVMEQCQYNMFERNKMEKEYLRLFDSPYNLGTTIWSPLRSGILTGKYNKEIPKDSRMGIKGYEWLAERWGKEKAELIPKVDKLIDFAKKKYNTSVACLALAWTIKNKNVSTTILGATKEHQIKENFKALEVAKKITKEDMEEIEKIIGSKPAAVSNAGRSINYFTNPL